MWKARIYDWVLAPAERGRLGELRRELLGFARGRTLELGVGTGLNLPKYPKDLEALIAIDPDAEMLEKARPRSSASQAELQVGDAQELPFEDGVFDTVVATLVFCSIPDPEQAGREAFRVLKPGGRFLLLEHVRGGRPFVGKCLDLLTPAWKRLSGGCHLNRDPGEWLERAGFIQVAKRDFWKGHGQLWVLQKPLLLARS